MMFPVQNLTFVVSRAFLPHLTKNLNNVLKNKEDYLKCIFIILSLCSPLMLGLAAVSRDFVSIFFNQKWFLLSDLLIWLAPTAIIQSILSTTGAVFTAYAKTSWLFFLGLIGAVLMVGSFFLGISFDIKTLTKFYFFANIINFFPVMFLLSKVLKFRCIDIVKILLRTIVPALIMFFSILYLNEFFILNSLFLQFFLKVLIGCLIYITFYLIFNITLVGIMLNQFKVRFIK